MPDLDDDLPQGDPIARLLDRARKATTDDEAVDALMDGLQERPDLARAMAQALRRFLDERGADDVE